MSCLVEICRVVRRQVAKRPHGGLASAARREYACSGDLVECDRSGSVQGGFEAGEQRHHPTATDLCKLGGLSEVGDSRGHRNYARQQLGSWRDWSGWKSPACAGRPPPPLRLLPGIQFGMPCPPRYGSWADRNEAGKMHFGFPGTSWSLRLKRSR